MCPNHIEPILDRYLLKRKKFSTSERVKIYRQYAQIEQKTILQEFTHMRQTRNDLLSKSREHQRLQRIEISQIPKVIEQFYLHANTEYQQSDQDETDEECVQVRIQWQRSIGSLSFVSRLPSLLIDRLRDTIRAYGISCNQY